MRAVLDHLANRKNNLRQLVVDRLEQTMAEDGFELSRQEIVRSLKALERIGLGRFIIGRRGKRTRFEWEFPMLAAVQEARGPDEADRGESRSVRWIRHTFRLRPSSEVSFELPEDLSEQEAKRLANFITTLPFEKRSFFNENQ